MGRYDLRLSEHEFWRLTPRRFSALLGRAEEGRKRADLRAAIMVSWLLRPHQDKGAKPLQPADIFGNLPEIETPADARIWYPGMKGQS